MNTRNVYRVPKRAWRRWCPLARHVFNVTFQSMRDTPGAFQAPALAAAQIKPRSWRVTAWNAAWIAADAVQKS